MKIPYERQHDSHNNRTCGAAALTMVYRSLGLSCAQNELWDQIKSVDSFGGFYSKAHKLCLNSLEKGFDSVCFSAKDPIKAIKFCSKYSINCILGHRQFIGSKFAHFTVLVYVKDEAVFIHDPELGSKKGRNREVLFGELLDLFKSDISQGDYIAENLIIVITNKKANINKCNSCDENFPKIINCPNCNKLIPLSPSLIFGCFNPSCLENNIKNLYCPFCDAGLQFSRQK